jgi:hypothetical protein
MTALPDPAPHAATAQRQEGLELLAGSEHDQSGRKEGSAAAPVVIVQSDYVQPVKICRQDRCRRNLPFTLGPCD